MDINTCAKLASDIIGFDCNNPLVAGVKSRAYIIHHDDINFDTTTITNGVITALKLKTGNNAFTATTLPDAIDANVAFAKGTYYNGWEHNFTFRIFDNTPEIKDQIDKLSKNKFVIIVENNYIKHNAAADEKGNTVFEAYGFYTGLKLKEATRDLKDADMKGGYTLTCGCDDNSKEPLLPLTVFIGSSLSATIAALDSLTASALGFSGLEE